MQQMIQNTPVTLIKVIVANKKPRDLQTQNGSTNVLIIKSKILNTRSNKNFSNKIGI